MSQSAVKTLRMDHVGSFLRPTALIEARRAFKAGLIDQEKLREAEDDAIRSVFDMQASVGMVIFTDGEFRRQAWQSAFSEAVEGFVEAERKMVWRDLKGNRQEEKSYSRVVGKPLRYIRRFTQVESEFLRAHCPGTYKLTIPSPILIARASYLQGVTDSAYSSPDEMFEAILTIFQQEVAALMEEQSQYLQFDEGFTQFVGDSWQSAAREAGHNPAALIAKAVEQENRLYACVDRERVALAIHVCRGNSRSRWAVEGTYDALAEQVFPNLNVDRFLLEYDSERAGDFSALRHVPAGKTAVLGLISTKTGALETLDDIQRRIDEAIKFAPLDRLAISPQCGFASVLEGNDLTFDDQRRKLELTVKAAEKIWGTI